jgi:16S rRNA (adenine1518-N6/adenine1519-N6)-dimethyltransferase
MPRDNLSELFDVCDAADRVIGQAPRGEVHRRGLLHRAVHIWVFNSRGELLLHRRSRHKDEYPLRFTSSASGHLNAGETYDAAAPRELAEELQLSGDLEFLVKLSAGPSTANEHSALYRLVTDQPPQPDPDEIESVVWRSCRDVSEQVARAPDDFTPPFRELWRWFEAHGLGVA